MSKKINKKYPPKGINKTAKQDRSQKLDKVTSTVEQIVTQNVNKTKFQSVKRIFTKFWKSILTGIGLTGLTISNVWPGLDFELKSLTDQNLLMVQVKNSSLVAIKNVEPSLYVYKLYTTRGDSVNTVKIVNHNYLPTKIYGNQKYTFEYSLNEVFFQYAERPVFTEALMAVKVKYDYWFFTFDDEFFVECRPDFHGHFIWLEMQKQDWFEAMEADTAKATFEDNPFIKRMMKSGRVQNGDNIPPIPN